MGYRHIPVLAPTQDMLDEYKKRGGNWRRYKQKLLDLMRRRRIKASPKEKPDGGCLLCSEDKPDCCHRRLVAE